MVARDGELGETLTFSEKFACLKCGTSMPELEPRIFSFNAPQGACPRCTGLGASSRSTRNWWCPILSSRWPGRARALGGEQLRLLRADDRGLAERYGIDLELPGERCTAQQQVFLYGTDGERIEVRYRNRFGRERAYGARFEGIIHNLERRYRETDSDQPARRSRSS